MRGLPVHDKSAMNQQDKEELLDPRVPCVVIRHLSGTKALSAEEIPIGSFKEITVGRDLSCDIRYDNDRDDLVSRQHLKITFGNGQGGTPEFTITDMESRNGTFVNLQRVTGSMKVQPGDIVQVGAGGPEFLFDFFPRARAAMPADLGEARGVPVTPAAVQAGTENVKRRSRAGLVLALALFVLIGAAAVVWRLRFPDKSLEISGAASAAVDRGKAMLAELPRWLKTEAGHGKTLADRARLLFHRDPSSRVLTPAEIAGSNIDAIVNIEAAWILIEPTSRRQLRQVYIPNDDVRKDGNGGPLVPGAGRQLPVFILTGNRLEPMLTLSDSKDYRPVAGTSRGTGSVASSDGLILTSRRLAVPWSAPYVWPAEDQAAVVAVLDSQSNVAQTTVIARRQFPQWQPADPAFMLENSFVASSGKVNGREVRGDGRMDYLTVAFAKPDLKVPARLLRASKEYDMASVKIDYHSATPKIQLQNDPPGGFGARVVLLSYKDDSGAEIGQRRTPAMWTGKVMRAGNLWELSGDVPGPEGLGAPVFDERGRVVAVQTAGDPLRPAITFAVPIRYGLELIGDTK